MLGSKFSNVKKIFIFTVLVLTTALFYQNCSQKMFSELSTTNESLAASQISEATDMNGVFAGNQILIQQKELIVENIRTTNSLSFKLVNNKSLLPNSQSTTELRTLYSPEFISDDLMLIGGWRTDADFHEKIVGQPEAQGADKIYYSKKINGQFQYPQPIKWTNPGFSDGKVLGYHANDISVVVPPSTDGVDRTNWLYMYFTCLPSQFFRERDSLYNNLTCLATSTNGGTLWTFLGVVIGKNNLVNNLGAWAPSAITIGNEIWIYYHNNAGVLNNNEQAVYLTRFKANGVEKIKTQILSDISLAKRPGSGAVNVDVKRQPETGKFFLIGDRYGAETLNDFVLYISDDGLNWSPYKNDTAVFLSAGQMRLITPHLRFKSRNQLDVIFGVLGTKSSACLKLGWVECSEIHQWSYNIEESVAQPSVPVVVPPASVCTADIAKKNYLTAALVYLKTAKTISTVSTNATNCYNNLNASLPGLKSSNWPCKATDDTYTYIHTCVEKVIKPVLSQ